MPNSKLDVIYILSSSHSGSTLLDLILGSHSSIESGGEIYKFPDYFDPASSRANKQCTCGSHVLECNYWNQVLNLIDATSIWKDVEAQEAFDQGNAALVSAMLEVSGKSIFCDSSKKLGRLTRWLNSPRISQVHILHLVRDGRAVAFSHVAKQRKIKKQLGGKHEYDELLNKQGKDPQMYDFDHTIRVWRDFNAECSTRFGNLPTYFNMRYEDLASDPRRSVGDFLESIGLRFEENQLAFYESSHHNLSGNRMRMQGEQEIRRDVRYLKDLSTLEWWRGTVIALPTLRRFGYPFRRPRIP